MAHPRAVTGNGCVICDGPCREPMEIAVHADYPFLPREIVDAMQPTEPEPTPPEPQRSKRLAEDRAHKVAETTAHRSAEDR